MDRAQGKSSLFAIKKHTVLDKKGRGIWSFASLWFFPCRVQKTTMEEADAAQQNRPACSQNKESRDDDNVCEMGSDGKSLLDLPAELLVAILDMVHCLRDLCAFQSTARCIDIIAPKDALVRWYDDTQFGRLLSAGAPLAVVQHAAVEWDVEWNWLHALAAAHGKRFDVFEWVCTGIDLCESERVAMAIERDATSSEIAGLTIKCERQRNEIIRAVFDMAAERNLHQIFGYLLLKPHWWKSSCALPVPRFDKHMQEAVRRGHLEVVQLLHFYSLSEVSRTDSRAGCKCDRMTGGIVFGVDHPALFDWLYQNGCSSVMGPTLRKHLADAIANGNVQMARRIALCIARSGESVRLDDGEAIKQAVDREHYAAVALAHEMGMTACTLSTLCQCARHGCATVLVLWAAGRLVLDENLELVQGNGTVLDIYRPDELALVAITHKNTALLRWLYEQPYARDIFREGAARRAVATGNAEVALRLHREGWAPLDRWNALQTALQSRNYDVVCAVSRYADCTPASMAYALVHAGTPTVVHLYRRYGVDLLIEALERIRGYPLSADMLDRLWVLVPVDRRSILDTLT